MKERFKLLFELCGRIAGFPRHMGTHSSGIVISNAPLCTIAPLTPSARGITQIWTLDKDDAELVGAIKFDVLSLRIRSAVNDAERDLRGLHAPITNRQLLITNNQRLPMANHQLPLSLQHLDTPVAWGMEDFSPWDKFLWSWRITGVCADCHVFAYLQDQLDRILGGKRKSTAPSQRRRLAAAIHLCGPGIARELIAARYDPERIGTCGGQSPATYVHRIEVLRDRFTRDLNP